MYALARVLGRTAAWDRRKAKRLLLIAANGDTRLHDVKVLVCFCGAVADLRQDLNAWDGWTSTPLLECACPKCVERKHEEAAEEETVYPGKARARFMALIKRTNGGKHG